MASGSGTGAAAGMALALADRARTRRVTMDWICMVIAEIVEGRSGWMSVLEGKGLEDCVLENEFLVNQYVRIDVMRCGDESTVSLSVLTDSVLFIYSS
jgi:hypothetical protein